MENLPLLVLEKIFSELTNLNEVIRCSSVCKNWRVAYEVCKPTTLCLFSDFMPLNYRLAYSTERVKRCQFFKTSEDLQFLASEITKTHFANIRKLIIIASNPRDFNFKIEYHPFSFGKQLNHFQKLEYLEIQRRIWLDLKDSKLDLPMLKVLLFNPNRKKKDFDKDEILPKVMLNTPSLEVLEIYPRRDFPFSEFILKFPHQLKSLTAIVSTFDPKTKFEQLECLAVRMSQHNYRDDFLSSFPNLKLLLLLIYCEDRDELEKQLIEQKKRYGLDDLEILFNGPDDDFDCILDHDNYTPDYENWRKYMRHKEIVQYCPIELMVDFNELIEQAVPLEHFQSFFRINVLKLGNVADQSLLLDFLKIVQTFSVLKFYPEFNLDVDFLDEVASFLTVHHLYFPENVLNRLSDFTFLEEFNFYYFSLRFRLNLPREAVSALLKRANFQIYLHYDGKRIVEYIEEQGSTLFLDYCHLIEKHPEHGFTCGSCNWISPRDLEPNSNSTEAVLKHIEYRWYPGDPIPEDATPAQREFVYEELNRRFLLKPSRSFDSLSDSLSD